ncbi:MAG: nucleotidyl transferase AbiEii/AbiGii toxin family protein [Saprospiraceae bacterium]
MIHPDSLLSPWIDTVASKLGRIDKALLEKSIRALFLAEQLKYRGLNFQFKGGTSLFLHFPAPHRFSIDVDIVSSNDSAQVCTVLEALVTDAWFIRWEEDIRTQTGQYLPMQHFKCYYLSQYPGIAQGNYILLDVIYQRQLPSWTEPKPIKHAWLKTQQPEVEVTVSTKEGLLGDKLTAFAPTTTGILYTKKRPLEIIKQLYDIGTLFDVCQDLDAVRNTFEQVANQEIAYRALPIDSKAVLDDTFLAASILCDRNEKDVNFQILKTGITNIRPHIFRRFILDDAVVAAAKAMYLTILLRQGFPKVPDRFERASEVLMWEIPATDFNRYNRLKKTNPEAFFYLYKTYERTHH